MKCSLLAVAAALLMSSSVWAQGQRDSVIDSNIPGKRRVVGGQQAGFVRKELARCYYRRMQSHVNDILRHSDPMTINYAAVGVRQKELGNGDRLAECLGEATFDTSAVSIRMSMSDQNLRSLLLEEAYLARVSSLPNDNQVASNRTYISTGDKLPQARGLGEFSDCLVSHDSAGADRLLRTMPGSDGEAQAAYALVPSLRACLTSGQTISFTASSIRGLAADGLWQRYVATSALAQSIGQR